MKFLVTILSSLMIGLVMVSSNFSPLNELQNFIGNKKRYFYASILAASGFFLIMASLLIGLIEVALQYEAQGYVFWSALIMLACGLFVTGVLCGIAARLTLPLRLESERNFAEFERQINFKEILVKWMAKMMEVSNVQAPGPAPAPAMASTPSSNSQASGSGASGAERPPDTRFQPDQRFGRTGEH